MTTLHLGQFVSLTSWSVKPLIGFCVVLESLMFRIPDEFSTQLPCDVHQVADGHGAMTNFDVAIRFAASLDAIQPIG